MTERRVDAFFYGLFMDSDVLAKSGVDVINPRRAFVEGFSLVIGNRATLVAEQGGRAYGILLSVTHADLNALYSADGLEEYVPDAVTVKLIETGEVPALCYNLLERPDPKESNHEYAKLLKAALAKYDFPANYISSIG